MKNYQETKDIQSIIHKAEHVVVVQADNPDADSLGSALALESILGEMGKKTSLYCAVDIPGYLKYLAGWDRIQSDLPKQFDASIVVDASTMTLLEKLSQSGQIGWLANKPCIVLDHHQTVDRPISFANVTINDYKRASAGELIYVLSKQAEWSIPRSALEFIMTSILGDTQGLSNQLATAETYRIMAELVEAGVDRPKIEELRRDLSKMPSEIYKFKAKLIERTEFTASGKIAYVTITQDEIHNYSPLYNPAPLIQGDMLQIEDVGLAIVFKKYADRKVTAALRSNTSSPVAGKIAEYMGGGGHDFASGFKVTTGESYDEIKTRCLQYASESIDNIKAG